MLSMRSRPAIERSLFEYWGHEASLLPDRAPAVVALAHGPSAPRHGCLARRRAVRPRAAAVLRGRARRDPHARTDRRLRAGKRRQATRRLVGLEPRQDCAQWLFWTGEITTHSRRRFERVYDLTERTLPARVVAKANSDNRRRAARRADLDARDGLERNATCAIASACRPPMRRRASPSSSKSATCSRSRSTDGSSGLSSIRRRSAPAR